MSGKRLAERLREAKGNRCHSAQIIEALSDGEIACSDFNDCYECRDAVREHLAYAIEAEEAELVKRVAELEEGLLGTRRSQAGGWEHRFPALACRPGLPGQTTKIAEEAFETQRAALCGFPAASVAVEAMDVIHAAETLLRLLEGDFGIDLDEAYAAVVAKNRERGYYDEEDE